MNLEELRRDYKDDILRIAEKYGVTDIRVFGSVARGDATEDSDLDLLVSYVDKPTFRRFKNARDDFSDLLGVDVEMINENSINQIFQKYIQDDIVSL